LWRKQEKSRGRGESELLGFKEETESNQEKKGGERSKKREEAFQAILKPLFKLHSRLESYFKIPFF
jgi:hypothetical protein